MHLRNNMPVLTCRNIYWRYYSKLRWKWKQHVSPEIWWFSTRSKQGFLSFQEKKSVNLSLFLEQSVFLQFDVVCTVHHIAMCQWATKCKIFIINFYYTVFCLLYMFRTSLVIHYQELGIIYYITQYNRYNRAGESNCFKAARLACTYVPNCVILYTMPWWWWWMTRFFRNI